MSLLSLKVPTHLFKGTDLDRFDEVSRQLAESEAMIEDLKSQLDTALSAEELLEELTVRNLHLTERIDEMRTTIEDLESLRELNDELEENHLAQEREMREELESKEQLIREQTKRIQTAEETNLDYESTIMRFRELVLSLQRFVPGNLWLTVVTWKVSDRNDKLQKQKLVTSVPDLGK
jgi:dynactin 1